MAAMLSEDLRAVVPGPDAPPARDGAALVAEQERLRTAVLHAVRELAELSAVLADAAAAAEAADGVVARSLGRIEVGEDPP